MHWYLDVLKNYVTFSGRARRQEYWMFVLINFIISLVLAFIGNQIKFPAISSLYALAVFLPSIAVAVRRLHDTDRSGWWMLIVLLPLIGALILLFFMVGDSQPGSNRFGPNPKVALTRSM